MSVRALSVRAAGIYAALLAASCFDSGLRWLEPLPEAPPEPLCELDAWRCTTALERCSEGAEGRAWTVVEDCAENGQLCAEGLWACVDCLPDQAFCEGQQARLCGPDGMSSELTQTCEPSLGEACRAGGCRHLCTRAAEEKSNVGCEYWAVDLDNAMINLTRNAAAQQYAIVVSNPQHDVPIEVVIHQDEGEPGDEGDELEIATAVIPPLNLRVFKLGPREVDGSPLGEFDAGSDTALSRRAYRVTSDFPVVAYQFNPLENVNVFSNDASLLKPVEALSFGGDNVDLAYVVAGWPQTIAHTDDPDTNFSATNPINLRSFLTIVGTRPNTTVVVEPSTAVKPGSGIGATQSGGSLEITLDAFDVANLETPDLNAFGADFTGTRIHADKPVAVFVGGEASDAPDFPELSERRCCADHVEEQLDPIRTAGKRFAIAHSPSRTATVLEAGGDLGVAPEPEYVRFVATRPGVTRIETTLAAPDDVLQLSGVGDWQQVTTTTDFLAEADQAIHVVQVMASQDAANVPRELPGGDPSLLVLPPREQFRSDYVFLTPDKYAFDFVIIVAPPEAAVQLDGIALSPEVCEVVATDGLGAEMRQGPPELVSYRCQLSFGVIDPNTAEVSEGDQNDGVHRVVADVPVGVVVFGFDSFVSYAYAAGTELREIAPPL